MDTTIIFFVGLLFAMIGIIPSGLLNISAEEFFTIYANRESYQEIPLLTADNIVIPDIGLRKALSKKELIQCYQTFNRPHLTCG